MDTKGLLDLVKGHLSIGPLDLGRLPYQTRKKLPRGPPPQGLSSPRIWVLLNHIAKAVKTHRRHQNLISETN